MFVSGFRSSGSPYTTRSARQLLPQVQTTWSRIEDQADQESISINITEMDNAVNNELNPMVPIVTAYNTSRLKIASDTETGNEMSSSLAIIPSLEYNRHEDVAL